jgi:tetratricopeptide (TPR) repeat protein
MKEAVMNLRSLGVPAVLCLVSLLGWWTAGCATSFDGSAENPSPEKSVEIGDGPDTRPEEPPESPESDGDIAEDGEEPEAARIGSLKFPESRVEPDLAPEPLPRPDPPEPQITGILVKSVLTVAADLGTFLEKAVVGYEGPVLTFEGEEVAEVRTAEGDRIRDSKDASAAVSSFEQSGSIARTGEGFEEKPAETPEEAPEEKVSVPRDPDRRTETGNSFQDGAEMPDLGAGRSQSAGSGTASASRGPAASSGRTRETPRPPSETLYGMPGDTLGVTLDGRGWIFTGMAEGNSTRDLSFVSRSNTPQYTDFIFQAEGFGSYILNFQKQDFASGSFETKRIAVHIVDSEEFARIVSGMKRGESGTSPGFRESRDSEEYLKERRDAARRLLRLGRREEALEIYLDLDRPDEPEILDTIAELAFDIGRYETAREAWSENLSTEGGFRERALIGLTDIALRTGDIESLDEYAQELLGMTGAATEEQLYRTGLFYADRGRYGSAITFFEAYLERYYSGRDAGSVYYLLGTVYEKNTEYRDIKRARYCYRAVVNDYPTSIYWDQAQERLRYLDRHFFSVR